MIVIAIIGMVLAIALPGFFKASAISKRTVCINNLVKITAAVEQFTFDNNLPNGATLTPAQEDDLYANWFRGGKPKCPSGGQYILNPVGDPTQVRCTDEAEGHKL